LVYSATGFSHSSLKFDLKINLAQKFELEIILAETGSKKNRYEFLLNEKLIPLSQDPGLSITPCAKAGPVEKGITCWSLVTFGERAHRFSVKLHKNINFPIDLGDSRIDFDRGVVLYASSYWYPFFKNKKLIPKMEVTGPSNWSWISSPTNKVAESLYLFGGPFFVYKKVENQITYQVFLSQNESGLAAKFLTSMPPMVEKFHNQIGPYPYSVFSVVENVFEETGYGFASATLLGSKVIRLPFIFTSSLPHEILHSWWGNGVFIDDRYGNWAEGLTTYQSDYAFAEASGKDQFYRLNQLLKYQDFHIAHSEKPISEFKYRHGDASQALGYGKSLMFFHMLKNRIGKLSFDQAIQDFYSQFLFKSANFKDILSSFEKFSDDRRLRSWFSDQIFRIGQASFEIRNAYQESLNDGTYQVQFDIDQTPSPFLFEFDLPILFKFKNQTEELKWFRIDSKRRQNLNFIFEDQLASIQLDPHFDVFRKVGVRERPAQLLSLFVSQSVLFFSTLPSTMGDQLPSILQSRFPNLLNWGEIFKLNKQTLLSETLVILGNSPEIRQFLRPLIREADDLLRLDAVGLWYRDENHNWNFINHDFHDSIFVFKNPVAQDRVIVWVSPSNVSLQNSTAFQALVARLTHYGSSSFLVLDGRRPLLNQINLPQDGELLFKFE